MIEAEFRMNVKQKLLLVLREVFDLIRESLLNMVRVIFQLRSAAFLKGLEEVDLCSTLLRPQVIQILNDPTATTKSDIIVQYTKLCAHETLSWLICAACSDKVLLTYIIRFLSNSFCF